MKKSVLIVDDEKEIGLLLSTAIRKKGFEVEYCDNLDEGLKLCISTNPSLLFLDINFPNGSGFYLLTEVRKINKQVYIIMISAFDGSAEREKANKLGADAFLGKPFDLQAINSILNSHSTS